MATIYLAVDVQYDEEADCAVAAGVVFDEVAASCAIEERVERVDGIEPYVPGRFYRREMPCILKLLDCIKSNWDVLIVDGYVDLGERPGIGRHLYDELGGEKVVIGVAKNWFNGSSAKEMCRGSSEKPLFVTAAGMPVMEAVRLVSAMHGDFRIPTLLARVDSLARRRVKPI